MLLKTIKKNWLAIVASTYALLVALFWLALRVNWSGISKALGADKNPSFFVMETPLLFCIFLWLAFAFVFVSMFVWKRKLPSIISLGISGVFTIIIIVVIALGACDYMSFVLPKFGRSVAIAFALIVFALLLFFPPVGKTRTVLVLKCVCVGCAALLCILVGYNVTANYITHGAVVYAVEDKYQIVFSTSASSIAWVDLGDGNCYYDLYAGSMKSKDLVHKIEVPQSELDAAGGYKICAQKMIYRGPFGGYKGKILEEKYEFRPVDSNDGLVYYCMSDVHGARKGAVNAAAGVENMDFLVMLGDNISMVDSEYDAQYANILAHDITHGNIPCIYLRGNHEIKGQYAEDLHKYVGSKNGNFYYTFTLSDDVFGVVLDLGEDHDDDWWEYYDTAKFDQYRNEQTTMLQNVVAAKEYENYNYTLVCCHIPIQFVNSRGNHKTVKNDWTNLINQIKPDLVVSGHQHDLYPFLKGKIDKDAETQRLVWNSNLVGKENSLYGAKGGVTDFDFNSFIVGKRGATQTDEPSSVNSWDHIGLVVKVNLAQKKQSCTYVNAKHEAVPVFMPFYKSDAQTEFVLPLEN